MAFLLPAEGSLAGHSFEMLSKSEWGCRRPSEPFQGGAEPPSSNFAEISGGQESPPLFWFAASPVRGRPGPWRRRRQASSVRERHESQAGSGTDTTKDVAPALAADEPCAR